VSRHVHMLGICGYAVSGAALVAQQLGYAVTGSDEDAYPPTSDMLTAAGIRWVNHHAAETVLAHGRPDLVVVGNQVREGNPEWAEVVRLGIPVVSEMAFYGEMTADRRRVAVCGTHGKTTTASLLAFLLEAAGMDPGFRLGTTSRDFSGMSARLGTGPFVFEGDEYTTAPWDARPKFLHAHPWAACVTRLELDHPDVYASFDAYRAPFVELVAQMPADGVVLVCGDDRACLELRDHTGCRTLTYGVDGAWDWRATVLHEDRTGQRIAISWDAGAVEIDLPLPGRYNAQNALAAAALAVELGVDLCAVAPALRNFRGPSRRFEVIGTPRGITVVDDYAHHPTEVGAVVTAARRRFAGARLIAVYVPHTYSRTRTLLAEYAGAFTGADTVLLGPIEPARERHLEGTVSSADIAALVTGVGDVRMVADADEAIAIIAGMAKPHDAVLCLSVRGFDNLAHRLAGALDTAHAAR
jgi:UDP-N-acetylmuramate: L-alanyl-gamma-D-glutamyl-meso-diaminopimelate ligase